MGTCGHHDYVILNQLSHVILSNVNIDYIHGHNLI